jgi:glycosyltransferase involved in cell wall biosynthesis
VVDSLDPGGAERHVTDLALALGPGVTVACSVSGDLAGPLLEAGVTVRPLLGALVKRRACTRYGAALRALVATGGFDLVHAHIHASEVAAGFATRGAGVPLVLTEHTEAPWRRPHDRRAAASAFAQAHRIVAVSRAVQRALVTDYRVAPERTVLVHPAVTRAAPGEPAALGLPPGGGPLVGFAGRLVASKGVDVLLRAVALLDVPPRVLVIGDGPERAALEQLALRLGLGDRVCFAGHRPDSRRQLDLLDVLAVPSRSDGTPLVVSEALMAGIPVVGAAVGGIPEQITDGREGWLVPPEDPRALAAALSRLLADPPLRARMAAAARRRAEDCSFERMVDALREVYAGALGPPRPVPRLEPLPQAVR